MSKRNFELAMQGIATIKGGYAPLILNALPFVADQAVRGNLNGSHPASRLCNALPKVWAERVGAALRATYGLTPKFGADKTWSFEGAPKKGVEQDALVTSFQAVLAAEKNKAAEKAAKSALEKAEKAAKEAAEAAAAEPAAEEAAPAIDLASLPSQVDQAVWLEFIKSEAARLGIIPKVETPKPKAAPRKGKGLESLRALM